ncbi:response regulator [Altererythrobacter aurantiacus]|uniref:Response regulator n=1 Tax=Parapontixanthobacter aurantiacus TaxID=1463599 RepID=A0A844ZBB7_9SPHN|nr:response regulator [Parapontixanthobacter aurantiacus]MXO84486.1 response regulator [Parapontixanthobacter aurantiacus]
MKLAGKNILLVEDEAIIGFALEDMISEEGANTQLVGSVKEGEDALENNAFDMAVVDVNLNGGYSYPLVDRLVEAGCTVIFATGYGGTTHPERFAMTPTVSKPYDLASILAALDRASQSA